MAGDSRPIAKTSAFLGAIQVASRAHMNTRELFGLLRQEADRMGVRFGPHIVTEVAQVRAGTSRMATGGQMIARASFGDAITGRMIGRMPYARNDLGLAGVPSWMVSFELGVSRDDGSRTEWHHLRYIGSLPATVGALMEDISNYSDLLSESYSVAVGDLGIVEIGEM